MQEGCFLWLFGQSQQTGHDIQDCNEKKLILHSEVGKLVKSSPTED